MKDEELIDKMREAVMMNVQVAWAGKNKEVQAVNDACLRSLAVMVNQHFVEQACDARDRYELIKQDLTDGVRADERARFKAEVVEVVKNCAAFNSRDRGYAKQELIKDIERL